MKCIVIDNSILINVHGCGSLYTMIYLNDSNFYLNITVLICSQCEGICTVHDVLPGQNKSLCMAPQTSLPRYAWLSGSNYNTVHDSLDQNALLCMTLLAKIPHCAWLPGPRYLTVHDSPGQDTSPCKTPRARMPHCAWLPGSGYLTVHDSLARISHSAWLPGQDISICMTLLAKIPHCAWLPGPRYLTVHDSTVSHA